MEQKIHIHLTFGNVSDTRQGIVIIITSRVIPTL